MQKVLGAYMNHYSTTTHTGSDRVGDAMMQSKHRKIPKHEIEAVIDVDHLTFQSNEITNGDPQQENW